eukprot:Colp12_sorted_trinity150504_noHs@18342
MLPMEVFLILIPASTPPSATSASTQASIPLTSTTTTTTTKTTAAPTAAPTQPTTRTSSQAASQPDTQASRQQSTRASTLQTSRSSTQVPSASSTVGASSVARSDGTLSGAVSTTTTMTRTTAAPTTATSAPTTTTATSAPASPTTGTSSTASVPSNTRPKAAHVRTRTYFRSSGAVGVRAGTSISDAIISSISSPSNSTVRTALDGGAMCHLHATCLNLHGSYMCQCNVGYVGNGTLCVAVDACDRRVTAWASATAATSAIALVALAVALLPVFRILGQRLRGYRRLFGPAELGASHEAVVVGEGDEEDGEEFELLARGEGR